MAVKPADLSKSAWAARAGFSRSIFNGIRDHGNPTTTTLARLLEVIGVSLADFNAGDLTVRSEVIPAEIPGLADRHNPYRPGPAQKPVPLVGSALGGGLDDIDEHVEMTELYLSEVLDHIGRPPSVAGDPKAYALTVVGDSMFPRYKPGERIVVSPRASFGIGDDVIVQLNAGPQEEPDMADRITRVLIKEVVRRGAAFIELKQYNPEMTFRVPSERVAAVHKVATRL